jgi:hypothetical protein
VVNEAAGEKTGGVAFSPANPELSEQLVSRVGYGEDFSRRERSWVSFSGTLEAAQKFSPARPQGGTRLRTKLEEIFSSRLQFADGAL